MVTQARLSDIQWALDRLVLSSIDYQGGGSYHLQIYALSILTYSTSGVTQKYQIQRAPLDPRTVVCRPWPLQKCNLSTGKSPSGVNYSLRGEHQSVMRSNGVLGTTKEEEGRERERVLEQPPVVFHIKHCNEPGSKKRMSDRRRPQESRAGALTTSALANFVESMKQEIRRGLAIRSASLPSKVRSTAIEITDPVFSCLISAFKPLARSDRVLRALQIPSSRTRDCHPRVSALTLCAWIQSGPRFRVDPHVEEGGLFTMIAARSVILYCRISMNSVVICRHTEHTVYLCMLCR